jgi:hypothetical protein
MKPLCRSGLFYAVPDDQIIVIRPRLYRMVRMKLFCRSGVFYVVPDNQINYYVIHKFIYIEREWEYVRGNRKLVWYRIA